MKVIRCSRCNRRCRRDDGWNVTMKAGVPVGYLCPGCQTAEENVEAEINLATTTYFSTSDGRLAGRPKVAP